MSEFTTVSKVYISYPVIGSFTHISSAQIFEAITNEAAIIQARLFGLYTATWTGSNVPPIIETITTDLTIRRILEQRVFTANKGADDTWIRPFDRSEKLLDMLADGSLTIVDSGGATVTADQAAAQFLSSTSGYDSTFYDGGEWENFFVDPDKIEASEDDRV